MANTKQVATIRREDLLKILPEVIPVMKSEKAKRYPLYLRMPFGPCPLNTPNGQEFCLEHGVFDGEKEHVYEPEKSESIPAQEVEKPGKAPEENPELGLDKLDESPGTVPGKSEKKQGFWNRPIN